ncbi:MAG: hypothetical protein ACOY3P_20265 [Planctomycetota bacterium]
MKPTYEQLFQIAKRVQDLLYRTERGLDADKEWNCADICDELAQVLARHGMAPDHGEIAPIDESAADGTLNECWQPNITTTPNCAALRAGAAANDKEDERPDSFTCWYLDSALGFEVDEGGKPLMERFTINDFTDDSIRTASEECRRFQEENAADLATYQLGRTTNECAGGFRFWLTRNYTRHGDGFLNGGYLADSEQRLSAAARACGERTVRITPEGLEIVEPPQECEP